MLRHYFLTSIRTLRQNLLYTVLSVFGIALTFVFVSILLLLVKAGKGEYILPKYAERTWHITRLHDGRKKWDIDIPKDLFATCVAKMRTPELIVLSSGNAIIPMILEDRIITVMPNCVSEDFFDVYRFKFLKGRPLNKQEIADGIPVVVIDRYLADQYFGKNEDPTGKNIELSGIQYRVTGVVDNVSLLTYSNGFANANIWMPYQAAPTIPNIRYQISFTGKNEASVAEMQAEFARILDEINTAEDAQYSIPEGQKKTLSQQGGMIGFSGTTLFLFVLILMLIPALNILSLNVSKSHDRSEEIAVRKAFGAPGHTVFGQLFVENTMITLVGAVLGMCITPLIVRAFDNMMLDFGVLPLGLALQFNLATIFWVAVPCALLFSFLSGSIPAWITSKREIAKVLKGELYTITSNWTRRRKLAWVFIEQALVFAVMLFCFTNLTEKIVVHFAKGDVNVDNVYAINYHKTDGSANGEKEANEAMFHNIVESMKEWESVELTSVSSSAIPIMGGIDSDTISFKNSRYRVSLRYCDENFYRMFSPVLSEGEWFRDADASSENPPALVTQRLVDDFGLTGSAIGQTVDFDGRTFRIIGVVEAFKERTSGEQLSALFLPISLTSGREYAVKYRQGMGSDFSKAFIAEFYRNFPRDRFNPESIDLNNLSKQVGLLESSIQFYAFGIPTAFLLIFAFMGTFGVIWTQSKKRMCEFGLRIAFGCTPTRLMFSFIFENLILTTIAMSPGLIVVANLYAYAPQGWEWMAAVGAAIVLMWLFSVISAWYPARQAAKVQPVEALKSSQ